MNNSPAIRLLASANNERGDLFTRLTKDLFFALGYDNLRLDVHKSGRELDIQGEHRFEHRQVVGECKAHAKEMGGRELNTFLGALTRERKRCAPVPVEGYFISLGGFTETGIEQEIETGEDGVILLDAEKVVAELERCHAIIARSVASERAGHCAQHAGLRDGTLDGAELMGHQRGYVWAIYYARGKERTHFALIHADGTPLAQAVAQEVIDADRDCGGLLHTLRYLAPPLPAPDRIELVARADASYRRWVGEECGFIHLDGLPADTDLSATRMKLERLFVPLKVSFLSKPDEHAELKQTADDEILSIGEVLERAPHLALLAAPGGGKSTLVKRLATAYAFSQRRGEVSDNLPQRDWLPLILRCRELRDRAHRPILELLDDIPRHAGMNSVECDVFRESIHSALRAGQALLLVDGLDEISDEGARQTFANHLRTFLAMFPQAALMVTSREAGFRLVAGVVASACKQAKLRPLDEEDVLDLCERWHVEVVGNNEKVRAEAKELGRAIWDNERVRQLTENPLLLTTLLVVKRWIGELPRSRAALYREAIRVLVRTWNVEGFAPLDEEETLAQLSYVACTMMDEGKQQIGQRALLKLLQRARRELEPELQFARISPQEFIDRIEYRSSLLMQTGHENIDGELQPVYEFRHLTFQEYLTARGYVEEQYPGRDAGRSLADLLEPHFEDERWREVIALAAVLAGRKAEELMKRLITASERYKPEGLLSVVAKAQNLGKLLYQCIRDEVQVTGPTLRDALRELASEKYYNLVAKQDWVSAILRGKFGEVFQEVVEQSYLAGESGFGQYSGTLSELAVHLRFGHKELRMSDSVATALRKDLEAGDRIRKIHAALVCMRLAHAIGFTANPESDYPKRFELVYPGITEMLDSGDLPCAVAASWALAWIADRGLLASLPEPETILALYRLWQQHELKDEAHFFVWALRIQPLLPRDTFNKYVWGDCDLFLHRALTKKGGWGNYFRHCAWLVGWYRRSPWSDAELAKQIRESIPGSGSIEPDTRKLLENLGDAGRLVIEKMEASRPRE